MKGRPHLCMTSEPIKDWARIIVLCRELIEPAKYSPIWDQQMMGHEPMLSSLHVCPKCVRHVREEYLAGRQLNYLYAVIRAEEEGVSE